MVSLKTPAARSIERCTMVKGWCVKPGLAAFVLLLLWTVCVWRWESLSELTLIMASRYNPFQDSYSKDDNTHLVSGSITTSSSSSNNNRGKSYSSSLASPSSSTEEETLEEDSDANIPIPVPAGLQTRSNASVVENPRDPDPGNHRPLHEASPATGSASPTFDGSVPVLSLSIPSHVEKDDVTTVGDSAAPSESNEASRPPEGTVARMGNNREGERNSDGGGGFGDVGNDEENAPVVGTASRSEGSTPASPSQLQRGAGKLPPPPSCISRGRIEKYLSKRGPDINASPEFRACFKRYERQQRVCVTHLNNKLANGTTLRDILNGKNDYDNETAYGGGNNNGDMACKYLIWTTSNAHGLGNKLVSLAGAFLYALLTNRTILLDDQSGLENLLCEPFSGSSWFHPAMENTWNLMHSSVNIIDLAKWPSRELRRCLPRRDPSSSRDPDPAYVEAERKCRSRVRRGPRATSIHFNKFVWKHTRGEWKFFCDDHQELISRVPFFFYLSNQYTVPGYYLIPSFRRQLHILFPEGHVFTTLGRLLFLPIDDLWTHIEDVYDKHLATASTRVGIQVRTFPPVYSRAYQVGALSCLITNSLLPPPRGGVNKRSTFTSKKVRHAQDKYALTSVVRKALTQVESREKIGKPVVAEGSTSQGLEEQPKANYGGNGSSTPGGGSSVAVFIASLSGKYRDVFEEIYKDEAMNGRQGKLVTWHQDSSENTQKTENTGHNQKAFMEMWLLSLSDTLFTSYHSTFGYVAQGLSGLVPFIIPTCAEARSSGICYMDPPNTTLLLEGCQAGPTEKMVTFLSPASLAHEFKHCILNTKGIQLSQRR